VTTQIHDIALYNGAECPILRIRGRGLFTPQQAHLRTLPLSTACQRGYHCKYQVRDEQLFLEEFRLALNQRDQDKVMDGTIVLFDMAPTSSEYGLSYNNIGKPMAFDGSLLLGRPRPSGSEHPTLWECEAFLTLTFGDGKLLEIADDTEVVERRLRLRTALFTVYSVLFYLALAGCIVYWLFR